MTNIPEITTEMAEQFRAFSVTVLYPVTITTDIRSKAGNIIAHAGTSTWGGFDSYGFSSVMVWTPDHYAGCKTSTTSYGAQVDVDRPVCI